MVKKILALADVAGVLFDVGDTLLATTQLMSRALTQTARQLERKKIITNAQSFCTTYRTIDSGVQGPTVNHLFSNLEIVEKTWKALGLAFTPRSFGMFIAVYRGHVRRGIKKNKRLIRMFASLRQKGVRIGVVTDGSTIEQIEQLFHLGVIQYVDALVTSEQVGVEKPAAKIFRVALTKLELEPAQTVMVGDDIDRDIFGAKQLGMRTILVKQLNKRSIGNTIVHPDVIVPTVLWVDGLIKEK